MLDGEPEVEGEVRAHFAFLGQHAVVGIEMEVAECDFKGFESHESQSQIVELAFSSASRPRWHIFERAHHSRFPGIDGVVLQL